MLITGAIAAIIIGLLFTVFWISGGFEQHYRVTSYTEKGIPARLLTFLVALFVAVSCTYLVPQKGK